MLQHSTVFSITSLPFQKCKVQQSRKVFARVSYKAEYITFSLALQ
jgi:hypothetical protein